MKESLLGPLRWQPISSPCSTAPAWRGRSAAALRASAAVISIVPSMQLAFVVYAHMHTFTYVYVPYIGVYIYIYIYVYIYIYGHISIYIYAFVDLGK